MRWSTGGAAGARPAGGPPAGGPVLPAAPVPVVEIAPPATPQLVAGLTEDVADAKTEPERRAAETALAVAKAKHAAALSA